MSAQQQAFQQVRKAAAAVDGAREHLIDVSSAAVAKHGCNFDEVVEAAGVKPSALRAFIEDRYGIDYPFTAAERAS